MADIGCCNFVEHGIEIEEGSVTHSEGARRMIPRKSKACRKEIEMLMEFDMIEPSKSPWACVVVMAKKKGVQLRFCYNFRYLNAVTIKDAYPIKAQALRNVIKKNENLIMCYVDDVVIATPTLDDHLERLDEYFFYRKQDDLKCKPSKCEILRDSTNYLSHLADKHGVRPDPEAVEAALTWKAPKTN